LVLPLDEFGQRLKSAIGRASYTGDYVDGLPSPPTFGCGEPGRSPAEFACDYLWLELFSKFDDGKSSDQKRAAAMEKFEEGELLCSRSNHRLSRMVGMPVDLALTDPERILYSARRKIRGILGKFDWNEVAAGFEFTSGASTRLPRVRSSVAHKYSGTPETTFGNSVLASIAISMVPAWKRVLTSEVGPLHLNLVHGNRVTTVAKNWKTDRAIAIEPDMNMYVQKGIGAVIRERLRKRGIDLNNQDTNGDLARLASATGQLATIDLSMASDTVSLELVRFLLPKDWCSALEQCRSPVGILPSGERKLYRKFSSMGNGSTFELESLIFYGLCLAVADHCGCGSSLIGVYGDDMIVPSQMVPSLLESLEFAGFIPNMKKTHVSGPFRESCGKHFFSGLEVTPFYVKREVNDLFSLFKIHNQLYRWAQRTWWAVADRTNEVQELLAWIRSHAPSEWRRPRIPDGYGDGAFIGSFDECRPTPCRGKRKGWEGFSAEVLADVSILADLHEAGWGTSSRTTGWRSCRYSPTAVGRLLMSLSRLESFRGDRGELSGGIPIAQRPRRLNIVVDGFALDMLALCPVSRIIPGGDVA
jgi:hypothetical protein